MDYVIVGDTGDYKDCLVMVCGKSYENAKKTLEELKQTDDRHSNLRIEQTDNGWWNDPFLAN